MWFEKQNHIFFDRWWKIDSPHNILKASMRHLSDGKKRTRVRTSNFKFSEFEDTPSAVPDRTQRVTAKMYYSNKMKTHQLFLNRYMPQKDKKEVLEKPEIFGNISLEEYKSKMDETCFKWIISPEKKTSPKVLKEMAKCFVARCEQHTGHKMDWQAVVHINTEHPHIHILINGRDQNGKRFRFRPDLIRGQVLRKAAMEIATHMLGERSDYEIALSRDKDLISDRYIPLDRAIENYAELCENMDGYSHVIHNVDFYGTKHGRRLAHLIDLKLATVSGGNVYLEKGWIDSLKALGRYNTFLEARNHLEKVVGKNLRLFNSEHGKIMGKVVHAYTMNAEDVWNNAYVIEDEKNGEAWYLPVFNDASRKLIGSTVCVEPKPNQKGKLTPTVTVLNWGNNVKEDRENKKRNVALQPDQKEEYFHDNNDGGFDLY